MFPWLHPSFVHGAIGLVFAAILCDVLALARSSEKLLFAGYWNTVFGAVATLFALVSGLSAADALGPHNGMGDALLGFHRIFAFGASAALVVLAGLRIAMKGYIRPKTRTLYLALAFFAAAFVMIAGALGGTLVYRYGLGIPAKTAQAVLDAQPRAEPVPTDPPVAPPTTAAPALPAPKPPAPTKKPASRAESR